MENKRVRKTNIIFSHLVQQLYGQNDYNRIRKRQTVSAARNHYTKILDTFQISLNETILVADKNQMESLNSIIDEGKSRLKAAKAFDFLDNIFLEIQTKLIFQLIGLVPDRWSQINVANRKEDWRLNSHRQIQYVQNNKQKESLIFSLLQSKYPDRFPDFMDFVGKIYWDECNHDLEKLMKWFKSKHPDIYHEII